VRQEFGIPSDGGHQAWGDRISYRAYYSAHGGSSIHIMRVKLTKQVDIFDRSEDQVVCYDCGQ
jgi:hypothetical protein